MVPSKDKLPSQAELLHRVVSRSFWMFYDNLWMWVVIGFLSSLTLMTSVLFPLTLMAMIKMARFALRQNHSQLMVTRFVKLSLHPDIKSIVYCFVLVILFAMSAFVLRFYFRLPEDLVWLKMLSSSVAFWMMVMIALLSPTLCNLWATEPDLSWGTTWKYAFFGLMAYPFLYISVLGLFVFATFICTVSIVGVLTVWLPVSILLWYNLFYIVFVDSKSDFQNSIEGLDDRSLRELFFVS